MSDISLTPHFPPAIRGCAYCNRKTFEFMRHACVKPEPANVKDALAALTGLEIIVNNQPTGFGLLHSDAKGALTWYPLADPAEAIAKPKDADAH